MVYVLMGEESGEIHDYIPKLVKPLLQEFVDVFPSDLSEALPPWQSIHHHIDLVLGSSLTIG